MVSILPLLATEALGPVAAAEDPIAHVESELEAGKKTIAVSPGVYRL